MSVTIDAQRIGRSAARRGPLARPQRLTALRATRRTAVGCADVVPQASPRVSWLQRVKTAAVAAIMLLGAAVSATQFATWSQAEADFEYGAIEPGLGLVAQP